MARKAQLPADTDTPSAAEMKAVVMVLSDSAARAEAAFREAQALRDAAVAQATDVASNRDIARWSGLSNGRVAQIKKRRAEHAEAQGLSARGA